MTLSLRARVTLWYTLTLIAALSLFAVNVAWGQQRLGIRRLDRELDGLATTIATLVDGELREQASPASAADEAQRALALPGTAVVVLDAHGVPLAGRWSGLRMPEPLMPEPLASGEGGRRAWTVDTATGAWRVHIQPHQFNDTTLNLLVGQSLADVRREQHEVVEAMEVAIPLVLLLAGAGGFWLASVGLRPVTQMASQAAAMPPHGVEDLAHADRQDELGQLARAFNGLVTRLRIALRTQQEFMADASHELRTPTSIVRAAAEVALSREHREEADYRETLTIVAEQARRLGRLVEGMLVLARADAGGYPLRPVELYLDELIAECCRAVQVLSVQRQITLRTAANSDGRFRGDEELLRQLLLNVLQNAVQHTSSGGVVSIDLDQDQTSIRIRITDGGPGIPDAARERIFDRFVQLDESRRSAGSGLGLPIARWIAEAHHGTLVLERSGSSGSVFCITLPR